MEKKKWYLYQRSGIYYVIFLDKVTGERLTAKSTGCRDMEKALEIIHEWYYDPNSFFNKQQQARDKKLLDNLLNDLDFQDDNIIKRLKTFLSSKGLDFEKATHYQKANEFFINTSSQIYQTTNNTESIIDYDSYPEEIKPIIDRINTLKFSDYILEYWNIDKSPYLKQLYRIGAKVPGQERFYHLTRSYIKHFNIFTPQMLLKDLKADDVNTLLGQIKNKGDLAETTMLELRNGITQALRFAYKNKIIRKNIARNVITFSQKSETKKEIFTKEEAKLIADINVNIFGNETYFLLHRLLLLTGCRIGEVLALKVSDIVRKTNKGFSLNISKNWRSDSRRLKETKTGRKDIVPLSLEMADMLLEYTKNMKDNDFIFKSKKFDDRPLNYSSVHRNFKKSLKKVGIDRPGLTIHSYRHTFATRLLEAGYSELQLLFLTRHESLSQIRLYTNHENEEREKLRQEAIDFTEKLLA